MGAFCAVWPDILIDWLTTDSRYSEDVLTSSREGELEAMAEERKIEGAHHV